LKNSGDQWTDCKKYQIIRLKRKQVKILFQKLIDVFGFNDLYIIVYLNY